MEPAVLVEVSHLRKRYGPVVAVDDVSFEVRRGEVLGFLGPNGAGKSTTMKMVTGFLPPDFGKVRVAGHDVTEQAIAAKRCIGYLPEGAPLYGDMTPRALLGFVAEVRGYRGAERRRRIDEAVEKVSLQSALEKPIETLSKGFKRRVGLAQAILHDPQVLILDEPTDGLDPNQKHDVRELITAMSAEKAIVLSTHILEEVEVVCSRAIIISAGRLVGDGTPGELAARSRSHNAVRVAVRGVDMAASVGALEALEGVASVEVVEREDDLLRLEVRPANGLPLALEVGELARARGWQVEELHVQRGRLDEVFRSITVGAAGEGDG